MSTLRFKTKKLNKRICIVGTRLYLYLNENWNSKVEGMCGNFNGKPDDDLGNGIEDTASKLMENWHTNNVINCPTPAPYGSETCPVCVLFTKKSF